MSHPLGMFLRMSPQQLSPHAQAVLAGVSQAAPGAGTTASVKSVVAFARSIDPSLPLVLAPVDPWLGIRQHLGELERLGLIEQYGDIAEYRSAGEPIKTLGPPLVALTERGAARWRAPRTE